MCGNIRTYLSMDVTTGDVITPSAIQRNIPCMFDKNKSLNVWAYNTETILAEKVESILQRGVANSRMRDFYDIYVLTKTQKYDPAIFSQALEATAKQRGSYEEIKQALQTIDLIESNDDIRNRWKQYQAQQKYAAALPFGDIMKQVRNVICGTEKNKGNDIETVAVLSSAAQIFPAQADRVYIGKIVAVEKEKISQEISPETFIEHKYEAVGKISAADVGKTFTISYDWNGKAEVKQPSLSRKRGGVER